MPLPTSRKTARPPKLGKDPVGQVRAQRLAANSASRAPAKRGTFNNARSANASNRGVKLGKSAVGNNSRGGGRGQRRDSHGRFA